jgi:hypothetical protein
MVVQDPNNPRNWLATDGSGNRRSLPMAEVQTLPAMQAALTAAAAGLLSGSALQPSTASGSQGAHVVGLGLQNDAGGANSFDPTGGTLTDEMSTIARMLLARTGSQ